MDKRPTTKQKMEAPTPIPHNPEALKQALAMTSTLSRELMANHSQIGALKNEISHLKSVIKVLKKGGQDERV
jgi:predicted  nucleic acid-binding Zn-ribbon protein